MKRLMIHDLQVPLRIDADGVARVGSTRVTLESIIHAYRTGCTAEEIAEQFPGLSLADVHGILAYLLTHPVELDAYLQERDRQAHELRQEVATHCSQQGVRERLLARQAARRANG